MPTTVNLLGRYDSLRRFETLESIALRAEYFNNTNSPRHSWISSNSDLLVVEDPVHIPSCHSLRIIPQSADSFATVTLSGIRVDGTARLNRDQVRYLFHSMVFCANALVVRSKISSQYGSTTANQVTTRASIFSPCRSNTITLNEDDQIPSSAYVGGDALIDIEIEFDGHSGNPIYLTFPSLIDEDGWKFNPMVRNSPRYIPSVYREIDEVQTPEYALHKLLDALTYHSGDALTTYANWFRFELDELPAGSSETDEYARSQLTDPTLANAETLDWISNITGYKMLREIYAVDPSTSANTGWISSSYPNDLTTLITADLAIREPVSIIDELVVVEKWSSVVTSTTTNVDLSTALIDGATFGGYQVTTGDRVLVRAQTNQAQNGIYIVAASGAASRSTDADASGEFAEGKATKVENGTFAGVYFAASIPSPFTLDTSLVTFAQITYPGVFDEVDLTNNMLVLLTAQDDPRENGVYIVSTGGAATRDAQMDSDADLVGGVYVEISSGTSQSGTLWRLYNEQTLTINDSYIFFRLIDRSLDFMRGQGETAMYGRQAATKGAIKDAAKRLLTGVREVAIDPNVPSANYITIRTILNETPGVDEVPTWTACRLATTENIDIANDIDDGSILDGFVLLTGDRVLVKNQADLTENGIYVVPASGAASRATDADAAGEFTATKSVYVQLGDLNGDTYYTIDSIPTTIGTDDITFDRTTNLGSSAAILAAIEPCRPLGQAFVHETINKFVFTFDSPALGRLGVGRLG